MAFHTNDPLFAPMLGAFAGEDDGSSYSTDSQSADEDLFAPMDFVEAFGATDAPAFGEFVPRMVQESIPAPVAPQQQVASTRKRKETPATMTSEPAKKCAARMSPDEKARKKLERQIARRQRKSIREKERRNNVNQLFEQVASMLGLPKEGSDRRTILSKTIDTLIQCGIPAPATTPVKSNAVASK